MLKVRYQKHHSVTQLILQNWLLGGEGEVGEMGEVGGVGEVG
jgi:hypothetical protein